MLFNFAFKLVFLIGFTENVGCLSSERVCSDAIITNVNLELLDGLKTCDVLNGSLTFSNLSLFNKNIKSFALPKVVAVRGFVRIIAVNHLLSVSDLLPNLVVINGESLFENKFALEIVNNSHLKNIGLNSLKSVNGSVHIERNPNLCPSENVKWQEIVPDSKNNVIVYEKQCDDIKSEGICDSIFITSQNIKVSQNSVIKCQFINGFVQIDSLSEASCSNKSFISTVHDILSEITEIRDYLKITNSSLMTDLSFFKSLKRIRGVNLDASNMSLIIKDNENLRHLWSAEQNVIIDQGGSVLESNGNLIEIDEESMSVTSYTMKVKWKKREWMNDMVDRKRFIIWDEMEFSNDDFCVERSLRNGLIKATQDEFLYYKLLPDQKYVYQISFEDINGRVLGSSDPNLIQTPKTFIQGIQSNQTSNSITIKWNKPEDGKKSIQRFEVRAFQNPLNKTFYATQDFCILPDKKEINILYTDLTDLEEADYDWMDEDIENLFLRELLREKSETERITHKFAYYEVDPDKNFVEITNLMHFSHYYISIKACYEDDICSEPTLHLNQTNADEYADKVTNLRARTTGPHSIELSWESPQEPNGEVLTYAISYYQVGDQSDRKLLCQSHSEFVRNKGRKMISGMTAGNYSVAVMVRSLNGPGILSKPIFIVVEGSHVLNYIVASLALVLIILIIFLLTQKKRIKFLQSFPNLNYQTFIYKPDDKFELKRNCIEISSKLLGSGYFGNVYRGVLKSREGFESEINVAVKTVKDDASFEDTENFLKEASVMKNFNNFHIIKLFGHVSKERPYLVVMELMINGDLKEFLRKNRPLENSGIQSDNYTTFPLLQPVPPSEHMAIQIADGMRYIAQKKFVHRDLASRNCMVAEDFTVKIGDFGLTRDVYESDYYRRGIRGMMPVRWMAPESLLDGIFTSCSDVFSFGVVLWEIATYANQPYQGMSNEEALNFIISGGNLPKPSENCSDKFYSLMNRCWKHNPNDRITFSDIVDELLPDAPPDFLERSFLID